MNSLGWARVQSKQCPYKKRLGHRHMQRDSHQPWKDSEKMVSASPGEAKEEPPVTLGAGPGTRELWKDTFLLLRPQACGTAAQPELTKGTGKTACRVSPCVCTTWFGLLLPHVLPPSRPGTRKLQGSPPHAVLSSSTHSRAPQLSPQTCPPGCAASGVGGAEGAATPRDTAPRVGHGKGREEFTASPASSNTGQRPAGSGSVRSGLCRGGCSGQARRRIASQGEDSAFLDPSLEEH